jgi:hypothetical protein
MRRSTLVAATLLLAGGVSVLVSPGLADEVEVVRIEIAAPLTVSSASDDKEIENSARLAFEDASRRSPMLANLPVRFELVAQDDQGDSRITSQICPLRTGTIHVLDQHGRNIIRALKGDLRLVCVFNPDLAGDETHTGDGSFKPTS